MNAPGGYGLVGRGPMFFVLFLLHVVGQSVALASSPFDSTRGLLIDDPVFHDRFEISSCPVFVHQPEPAPTPDFPEVAGPEVIHCASLTAPVSGLCEVTGSGNELLLRGTVLAPGQVLVGGEVRVDEDGKIACVGCDCSLSPAGIVDWTEVTCAEGIISPGLINANDHLTFTRNSPGDWGDERFNHRHDWRLGWRGHTRHPFNSSSANNAIHWGEMRQVMAGTTSVNGAGAAPGFLRNLDNANHMEGLDRPTITRNNFPLGSNELRGADCDYATTPSAGVVDAHSFMPVVAEGIDKEALNEFRCLSREDLGGVDVTSDNGAFVHMIALTAMDGAELAAKGAGVVWSPRSHLAVYGNTTPVTMLHRQGVEIALATNWTPSGSINILRELACADSFNSVYLNNYFADWQLWDMATGQSARVMGYDDVIGSLTAGLHADIAIFADQGAPNPFRAVIESGVEEVALVLRDGLPLYGDADLVAALPGGAVGCDLVDGGVCGVSKRLCAERETGSTLAALIAANPTAYGLFFCDEPPGEPSCVPFREGEYTGEITEQDSDGDGIPDHLDNCPLVFNPIRPMDGRRQADFDGDGIGDVCDPCPLDPDTGVCADYDPLDRDRDGILDELDNCPVNYNPGQHDADQDGIGDACDRCPCDSNLDDEPCTLPIHEIKLRLRPVSLETRLEGVVTATAANGFFLATSVGKEHPGLLEKYSAIEVHVPAANPNELTLPQPGDEVGVLGEIAVPISTRNLVLSSVTGLELIASARPMPMHHAITAAEVQWGTIRSRELEAGLVELTGQVTSEPDFSGAFLIDDAIIIDTYLHTVSPPTPGSTVTIRGILRLLEGTRISPASEDDLVVHP